MGMRLRPCVAAGLAGWIGLAGVAAGDGGLAGFLAADGQLRAELRVRDGQHGMVGETGTVWVIEPSGAYRVSSFINQEVGPPQREGALSAEQLERLAEILSSQDFAHLPPRIDETAQANPRVISVAFGRHSATLVLPPGPPGDLDQLIAGQAGEAGPRGRLLAVVDAVLEVTAAE